MPDTGLIGISCMNYTVFFLPQKTTSSSLSFGQLLQALEYFMNEVKDAVLKLPGIEPTP